MIAALAVETQGENTRKKDASARNGSWRKQCLSLNKEGRELVEHWVRGGKVSPVAGRATCAGQSIFRGKMKFIMATALCWSKSGQS